MQFDEGEAAAGWRTGPISFVTPAGEPQQSTARLRDEFQFAPLSDSKNSKVSLRNFSSADIA